MKFFYYFIICIFLINCSFDNKSGIWKNENSEILKKANNPFSEFKKFNNLDEQYNKTVIFDKNIEIKTRPPINNNEWKDIFYNNNNNLSNFTYFNKNELKIVGKKISRNEIENHFLIEEGNLITNDFKGNIIVFSIKDNYILNKFNFYKKQYKKIKKKLNLITDNNIIYVSDNLGYLYAYDYKADKIKWAKKYKIPFRSNLKISKNKLITSNQDNNLIFFDKNNGNILKLIPSEESFIKNKFINNISLSKESVFFLNSYGSLYSVNIKNMELNWFINLSQSLDLNPSNLFLGSTVVNQDNKIVVSSNRETYIIDSNYGTILSKKNFSNEISPIINNTYVFFLTKNDFLICMDLITGNILYAYDINQLIANFLNTKKNNATFKNFLIMNNNIFIFLDNSYYLKFNIEGKLLEINKLPSKIKTHLINIDSSLLYINKKNKLVIIN